MLLPKRHQIKHLEFVVSWFGTRGSEFKSSLPDQQLSYIPFRNLRSHPSFAFELDDRSKRVIAFINGRVESW